MRNGRGEADLPLLSRPRGAVDSGPAAVLAAVESVAVSAVAWSCGCVVGFGWMVVRFVRVIRVPACAVRPCVPCVPCVSLGWCVPAPPGVFLPGPFVSRLPPVSFDSTQHTSAVHAQIANDDAARGHSVQPFGSESCGLPFWVPSLGSSSRARARQCRLHHSQASYGHG